VILLGEQLLVYYSLHQLKQ